MRTLHKEFKAFVTERENIRLRRMRGDQAPWSEDPILAKYSFCNINREHDAVTRWIREWAQKDLIEKDQPPEGYIYNFLAARIWNHPPTLSVILPIIKPLVALNALDGLRAIGEKTMRGAYMMPAHGNNGKGRSVDAYYMSAVAEAQSVTWRNFKTFEEVAVRLTKLMGIGDFLANQVVADLRHAPPWGHMPDRSTFVLCGPGTRRGLDRYFGETEDLGNGRQQDYRKDLLGIRQQLLDEVFFNTTFYDPNNLSNCFCEFDKYERARIDLLNNRTSTLRLYGNQSKKH